MGLIRILSCCIHISKKKNLNLLTHFFKDYAKTNLTKKQLILLNIHLYNIKCDNLYLLLEKWISLHSDSILKKFIY